MMSITNLIKMTEELNWRMEVVSLHKSIQEHVATFGYITEAFILEKAKYEFNDAHLKVSNVSYKIPTNGIPVVMYDLELSSGASLSDVVKCQ